MCVTDRPADVEHVVGSGDDVGPEAGHEAVDLPQRQVRGVSAGGVERDRLEEVEQVLDGVGDHVERVVVQNGVQQRKDRVLRRFLKQPTNSHMHYTVNLKKRNARKSASSKLYYL